MISVSPGNFIPRDRIVAIIFLDSNPIRDLITEKLNEGKLVDATRGKKSRSGVLLDNGVLIISSIKGSTLAENYELD